MTLKEHMDWLLARLGEEAAASLERYADYVAHPNLKYLELSRHLAVPGFSAWLQVNDPVIRGELAITGRTLLALQSILRAAAEVSPLK